MNCLVALESKGNIIYPTFGKGGTVGLPGGSINGSCLLAFFFTTLGAFLLKRLLVNDDIALIA